MIKKKQLPKANKFIHKLNYKQDLICLFNKMDDIDDEYYCFIPGKGSVEGSQASGSPTSPQSVSGSERETVHSGSPPGTPHAASGSASPAQSGSGAYLCSISEIEC